MAKGDAVELVNLQALEVSLVDKGANRKKRFPVYKQEKKGMDEMNEILKSVIDTQVDDEKGLEEWFAKSELSDKAKEAIRAQVRLAASYKDELPSDVLKQIARVTGYETEEVVVKEDTSKVDEISKAYEEKLQAIQKKHEEVLKAFEDERDLRQLNDWVQKCEKSLPYYPAKTEEVAKRLQALDKVDSEECKKQFEEMQSVSKMLQDSALLRESGGRSSDQASSPMAKIQEMANSMVEKSSGALSPEKAFAKAMETEAGSRLYAQYLSENPAQTGRR